MIAEIPERYACDHFPPVYKVLRPFSSVKTAKWIGDCFIYTTSSNRLNYFVGSESYTITPFDQ